MNFICTFDVFHFNKVYCLVVPSSRIFIRHDASPLVSLKQHAYTPCRCYVSPLPLYFAVFQASPSVPDHTKRNVSRRRRTFTRVRYTKA